MAQYFREFRDLTSDHENFPHENLVLLWAWLPKRSCVRPSASERVEPKYVKAVSDSVRLLSKNEQKLPVKSARTSKQLLSSCIESANNHVEEVAKETTAEGAKGRKRGP